MKIFLIKIILISVDKKLNELSKKVEIKELENKQIKIENE